MKIIRFLLVIGVIILRINYTYCYYNSNNIIRNSINTSKYNIKFNNNFDSIDSNIEIIGNNVKLPIVSKIGYTNMGYMVDNNIVYENILINDINGKLITPIWKLNNYTINYDLDGGLLDNKVDNYNIEDNFVLDKPIKEGYKFIGWTGSNGDIPEENINIKNMYGDKYYKANYIHNKIKISTTSIIQNIEYENGLDYFTFDIYIDDELIKDDVIDYEDEVNYNSKVRIVMNQKDGYNIKSIQDSTYIVKEDMNIDLIWFDDIEPIITNFVTEKIDNTGFGSNSLYSNVRVRIEGYDNGSGIDKYYTWYYADKDTGEGRIEGQEHLFERIFRVNTIAGKTFCASITDKASNTSQVCRIVNINS